jgi:hypothetical protein
MADSESLRLSAMFDGDEAAGSCELEGIALHQLLYLGVVVKFEIGRSG